MNLNCLIYHTTLKVVLERPLLHGIRQGIAASMKPNLVFGADLAMDLDAPIRSDHQNFQDGPPVRRVIVDEVLQEADDLAHVLIPATKRRLKLGYVVDNAIDRCTLIQLSYQLAEQKAECNHLLSGDVLQESLAQDRNPC